MELKVLSELRELKWVMLLRLSRDDKISSSLTSCAGGKESRDHECMLDGAPRSVDMSEGMDSSDTLPPPEQQGRGWDAYTAAPSFLPGAMAMTTAETTITTKNTPMMPIRKGLARGARLSFSACLCARAKNAPHKTITDRR